MKSNNLTIKSIINNDPDFKDEHIQTVEEVQTELKEITKKAIQDAEKNKQDGVEHTKEVEEIEVPNLESFINEEINNTDDSKIELPTFKTALDDIERNIPAEMIGTPQHEKFLKIKERFMGVSNFNFLQHYRINSFFLPKAINKLKKNKDKKNFVKSYIALATKKLEKNKKFMYTDPSKAYAKFVLAADNALEREAFYNFFIVLCHYIVTKDISANAYAIIYTLNRMIGFKDSYDKENISENDNSDTDSKIKELNYHALKQCIIANYSGDILKWKKGKITTPPSSDKVVKMEIKSSLTVID